ncbi:type IX secretion system protein PorD [Apibacter adventoris]|uniref:DUF4835 domain-containing protein n=1 Tax=Apibacter adventoris TaxID=1679466 RepID=A0A2S8ABE6_9FLAO|nr:DUF4835 family protein [Apibacter adventoris]PQL91777.1 DUF4835 domain-containing protein [Apibacter adventoris]
MKHFILLLLFLSFPTYNFSQELLANVIINYSKVQGSNNQVFITLEKSLKDFINNTSWTTQHLSLQERIKCSFSIIIEERKSTDQFKGSILVQSSRPVFNSTYQTPVLNYQDKDFTFNYIESENLTFNGRRFSGKNLVDVISFYVFMILGYDADTFSPMGGTEYFNTAQKISDNAINQGYNGWNSFDGPRTRGGIIADIINDKSSVLRNISYQYHRLGLDNMATEEQKAKTTIANSLLALKTYSENFQFYPLDIFLSSKKEEIKNIFSGGQTVTAVNINDLKTLLQNLSPINSSDYWNKIKN